MDHNQDTALVYVWGAWSENMLVPVPLVSTRDLSYRGETLNDIETIIPVDTLTFIIDKKSRLWVWGFDTYRLGLGEEVDHAPKPTLVSFGEGKENVGIVQQISVGTSHVLALTSNGDVYSWGDNTFGQLGTSVSKIGKPNKVLIKDHKGKEIKASQVLCVRDSSFAVCEESVYAWGFNEDGNLGLNNLIPTELPNKIPAFEDVHIDRLIESGQRVYAVVKSSSSGDTSSDEEGIKNILDDEELKQPDPDLHIQLPLKSDDRKSKPNSPNTSVNTSKKSVSRRTSDTQAIEKNYATYMDAANTVNILYNKLLDFDSNLDNFLFSQGSKSSSLKITTRITELNRLTESVFFKVDWLDQISDIQPELKSSMHTGLKILKDSITLRKVMMLFAQIGPYFRYLALNSFKAKIEQMTDKNILPEAEDIDTFTKFAISKILQKMDSLSEEFETLHYGETDFFGYIFATMRYSLDQSCALWSQINKFEYDNSGKDIAVQTSAEVNSIANEIWKCVNKMQGAKLHNLMQRYPYNEGHRSIDDYEIDLFKKSDKILNLAGVQLKKLVKRSGSDEILKKLHRLTVENIELIKLANDVSKTALSARATPRDS